jgi:Protein of unknown function (DUF1572)
MTTSDASLAAFFLEFSRNKLLHQYWPRLRACVESLTDEQIWWRPNTACNSIGNLLLHLNGNVGQWLVSSFNQLDDARNRPQEFSERRRLPGKQLLDRLEETMLQAAQVLSRLSADELGASYQIQGYTVRGIDAVYQVVEHFGLHYGQVLYITKQLRGEDLGFYRELEKTGHAS